MEGMLSLSTKVNTAVWHTFEALYSFVHVCRLTSSQVPPRMTTAHSQQHHPKCFLMGPLLPLLAQHWPGNPVSILGLSRQIKECLGRHLRVHTLFLSTQHCPSDRCLSGIPCLTSLWRSNSTAPSTGEFPATKQWLQIM